MGLASKACHAGPLLARQGPGGAAHTAVLSFITGTLFRRVHVRARLLTQAGNLAYPSIRDRQGST